MKGLRFWLATAGVLLVALPGIGRACSPAPIGLYEQFSKHSAVFLGTVKERIKEPAPGRGVYTIAVDEAFKGLTDKGKRGDEIEVTLSENEQCGLGRPDKNSRILVFMNGGDVVNLTSHSRLIWLEAEQKEANLNPVMDDLVTLRRMLFPRNQKRHRSGRRDGSASSSESLDPRVWPSERQQANAVQGHLLREQAQ